MELKLTVNYQPRIVTNPVRYDSKMQNVLTDAENFTCKQVYYKIRLDGMFTT